MHAKQMMLNVRSRKLCCVRNQTANPTYGNGVAATFAAKSVKFSRGSPAEVIFVAKEEEDHFEPWRANFRPC
jgi:hypothetical protein